MNKIFLAALALLLFTACQPQQDELPDLLIGGEGLQQQASRKQLASGLVHWQVSRGTPSSNAFFTLSSGVLSEKKVEALVARLTDLGHQPRVEAPAEPGPRGNSLGALVRVGEFDRTEQAEQLQQVLKSDGIHMAMRYTAEDGGPTSGPFAISILELNLEQYPGRVASALAQQQTSGTELTSTLAENQQALAAINGGFFAWQESVGTTGDPAGVAVVNGELVSDACFGRPALVIENTAEKLERIWIAANITTEITAQIDGRSWQITGTNRKSGLILNCGNPYAEPHTAPVHDYVCRNPNELVLFDESFAAYAAPADGGIDIVVDASGKVTSVQPAASSEIPQDGFVLQATGNLATAFNELGIGSTVAVHKRVFNEGTEIPLSKGLYIVNGGPALLRNGLVDLSARYQQGWETRFESTPVSDTHTDPNDDTGGSATPLAERNSFYHGWVVRRHPRTAVGLHPDGRVFVVVVYGRQPGVSAGASLTDMATIFTSIGVNQAINLDGGGSSVMIVDDQLTGVPSDRSGERAIGDAILFLQ